MTTGGVARDSVGGFSCLTATTADLGGDVRRRVDGLSTTASDELGGNTTGCVGS